MYCYFIHNVLKGLDMRTGTRTLFLATTSAIALGAVAMSSALAAEQLVITSATAGIKHCSTANRARWSREFLNGFKVFWIGRVMIDFFGLFQTTMD